MMLVLRILHPLIVAEHAYNSAVRPRSNFRSTLDPPLVSRSNQQR